MEKQTSGKEIFRPRARIIQTIGEELISNDLIALVELVKNSYDADAKKIEIIFKGDIESGEGEIEIIDDGIGMDLETLKKGWFEPASILKKGKKSSKKGRRLLGEKGVGRFASAKLSKNLKIITKMKDSLAVEANFNWKDFSNEEKYLDEINCEWEQYEDINKYSVGTSISLLNLNSKWDWDKLRELKTTLSRLINPISPIKGFKVHLKLPDKFEKLNGEIEAPDSLNYPTYSIRGSVNKEGILNAVYISSEKDEGSIDKSLELSDRRKPSCGSFNFEFRVWDRDSESMKSWALRSNKILKNIRGDLNAASGISIYRDGFRVFPYGDLKNDWLRLNMRRVQNPTMRLSNNQLVGYVSISLETNPTLKDQSNREGIVESDSFDDFQEIIKKILEELEAKRYKERRKKEDSEESKNKSIFSDINITPVIEMVQRKLPNDAEATVVLVKTQEKIDMGLLKVQEVLSRYRRLSTLGQLIDTVLHDGNSYLSKTKNEFKIMDHNLNQENPNIQELKENLKVINDERETIRNLFQRLEPFSGRRNKQLTEVVIEDSISNVFSLLEKELSKGGILISLPKTKTNVKIRDKDFQTIILNLLQNSIYWLNQTKKKGKRIEIKLNISNEGLVISFLDNGPGIERDDSPFIFDPYFTRKEEGVGLGLTIVGELCAEMGGVLDLVECPDKNTMFRIALPIKNDN